MPKQRIAVVGAGVSGLGAAYALKDTAEVVVYEARDRLGGHANTVDAPAGPGGGPVAVDTGFIVFNTLNYPNMTRWFDELGVPTRDTDMSFAFAVPGGVEWSSNAGGLFAQKRNLISPTHLGMLRDVLRFNASARRDLRSGALEGLSLGDYLTAGGYGQAFRERYLVPMGAAIWSASVDDMLSYPAQTLVRFFDNHRLMHARRPTWRTVVGGSRSYVSVMGDVLGERARIGCGARAVWRDAGGAFVHDTHGNVERYDHVIFATHSDRTLSLLQDPSETERFFLGAIQFAPNRAVLHSDQTFMPKRRAAWAAWNCRMVSPDATPEVTYDMNALQHIPADTPLYVTLNPQREPDPARVYGEYDYDHPQFTNAAIAAQRRFNTVQGENRAWFAGAWLGYGFHEDGLRAGLRVALKLGGSIPWDFVEGDVDGGAWPARTAGDARVAAAE